MSGCEVRQLGGKPVSHSCMWMVLMKRRQAYNVYRRWKRDSLLLICKTYTCKIVSVKSVLKPMLDDGMHNFL